MKAAALPKTADLQARIVKLEEELREAKVSIARLVRMYYELDIDTPPPLISTDDTSNFRIQSEDVVLEEIENIQFADDPDMDHDGFLGQQDEVSTSLDTGDYELATFLERPVRIRNYSIPLGETYSITSFQPWFEFFNHPAIKKKLDNYAYVQCDLKMKVVVNSTPFIYGQYAMSYQPLQTFNPSHNVDTNHDEVERLILTQRPTIYLESHKNKGGEMLLPFFYYKNWLPLTSADTQGMGKINLYPIIQFAAANGTATTPVSIQVYVSAMNAKLAGNTVSLAVQAKDEYYSGPVSGVATAVASATKKLESVPIIGKFARATTIGASAVASVAGLFGFTNVPVIDDVKPLKNQPFHGFASSEIGVPLEKLTLDPKNELTVDPSIAGLIKEDELAISYIAKRPALLRVVRWQQSDVTNFSLFRCNVTPTLCRTVGSAPNQRYVDVPAGYISRLFSNWRGDIVIRIVIIRSQYHQGRLRVTYDPTGDIFANSDSDTVTNTKVVDISDNEYIDFRIPYMQPQSWLQVIPNITRDNSSRLDSDSPYSPNYHNGRFEIRVLNRLTGPDTSSQINFAVYAFAADNFELANPSDFATNTSVFQVVTAPPVLIAPVVAEDELEDDTSDFEEQSADEPYVEMVMGKVPKRPNHIMSVNFGEDIRSMRSLMRRTCLHMSEGSAATLAIPANTSQVVTYSVKKNIYPCFTGFDPQGGYFLLPTNGVGSAPGNRCKETPYTWMSPCFIGQRGSMNYAFNSVGEQQFTNYAVQRVNAPLTGARVSLRSTNHTFSNFPNVIEGLPGGVTGMALQNERTQTGLQFSVPFMNKNRFCSTNPEFRTGGAAIDDSNVNNFIVTGSYSRYASAAANLPTPIAVLEYHGIGADYSPLWFLSTPRRWIYDQPAV